MRKALIVFGVVILIAGIAIGMISHNHPILLKYWKGEATSLGSPVDAKVYTDGRLNREIKVYKDPKYKNDYLLSLKKFDTVDKYINIDLDHKSIGMPFNSSKDCYDTINGKLYQSNLGARIADFIPDLNGFNLFSNLTFSDNEIKFEASNQFQLKFDSVRIELYHK
jgi:hypothetical protein